MMAWRTWKLAAKAMAEGQARHWSRSTAPPYSPVAFTVARCGRYRRVGDNGEVAFFKFAGENAGCGAGISIRLYISINLAARQAMALAAKCSRRRRSKGFAQFAGQSDGTGA
jgi:hypothetical protein